MISQLATPVRSAVGPQYPLAIMDGRRRHLTISVLASPLLRIAGAFHSRGRALVTGPGSVYAAGHVAPAASYRSARQENLMQESHATRQEHAMAPMKYTTFAKMIVVGTVIMFGLMYLNTYSVDHIFFSETRAFMALIMGATMAIVMLAFMWKMYPNKALNIGILVASAAVFVVSLWLVRSQATIADLAYMRAMIPHHSIAILTSERANIADPRVRKLADGIIAAQRKEIGEMKDYIRDLEQRD